MLKMNLQRFGAPGLTSPIRTETFKRLQLNAGIFIKNLDYSSISDAAALKTAIAAAIADGTKILGATRGGGSFVATRELRTPEVDGMRYPFKGSDFVDSVDAYLSTTLLEIVPGTIKDLLGTATATTSGKKTTIKMHTAINTASDYIASLTWIGDLADGQLIAITLKNAFNTADFSLTFTDKGEGTLAAECHARQENVRDYDEAPFEIVYFDTDGELGSLTVTSAAGSAVGGTAITVDYTLGSGEHFCYKYDTTAPTIGYHEMPDYTWTQWDGASDIAVGTAANGKKITIVMLNANGKAEKSGNATLAVKLT